MSQKTGYNIRVDKDLWNDNRLPKLDVGDLQWPVTTTAEEAKTNGYLESLTPIEELAFFMAYRGLCFESASRMAEAKSAHAYAHRLVPGKPAYLHWYAEVIRRDAMSGPNANSPHMKHLAPQNPQSNVSGNHPAGMPSPVVAPTTPSTSTVPNGIPRFPGVRPAANVPQAPLGIRNLLPGPRTP